MTSLRSGVAAAWLLACVIGLAASQGDDDSLVIEHGSGFIKVGWSSDANPKIALNFRGRHNYSECLTQDPPTRRCAIMRLNQAQIFTRPTSFGIITKIDEQKQVWADVLKSELGTSVQGRKVLIATRPNIRGYENQAIVKALTEMGAVEVSVEEDASLAAEAHGLKNAVVLQAGFGLNSAVAVVDYFAELSTYDESRISGDYLTTELKERNKAQFYDEAEKFKQESCYVALDVQEEARNNPANLNKFNVIEDLFNPPAGRYEEKSVHKLVRNAIESLPQEYHKELWANVVIAGGSTLFPGFKERLQKELTQMTSHSVKIHAAENRWATVWQGGKKVANW